MRPQLEYASSVWDNSVKRNINKVKSVQRNAARLTCRDYRRTSSVSAMLQKLQWDLLQQRRACSRVLIMYRIRNGLVTIPAAAYLEPVPICTRSFKTRYMTFASYLQTVSRPISTVSIYLSTGLRPVFTARCYACAVLAMGLSACLSVCLTRVGVLLKRINVVDNTRTTPHDSAGTQVF